MSVHVFPVPDGMTPEEAWAEISVFGHLYPEGREVSEEGDGGMWTVMEVEE